MRLPEASGRWLAAVGGAFAGAELGGALFALAAAVPFRVDSASFLVAALLARRLRADLAVQAAGQAPARLRRRSPRVYGGCGGTASCRRSASC